MQVTLVSKTENPQYVIWLAARRCMSNKDKDQLSDEYNSKTESEISSFIENCISSGHLSVLEHVNFTFHIEGISRACQQQLTRHRLASYSVQSMRYNDAGLYPIAATIAHKLPLESLMIVTEAFEEYKRLINLEGVAKEDARMILPLGVESSLIMTMNVRTLLHFFNERLCTKSQEEISILARKLLHICRKELPTVFNHHGCAKCVMLGYCPETKERSCGRKPVREEVLNNGDAL